MIDVELAKRTKALLKRKKLRQKEVAARIPMDYQRLTRILNGRQPLYAQDLPRLAAAMEVRLEDILGTEAR
jgi:transcriptional regulator with XRE-family HTH domain